MAALDTPIHRIRRKAGVEPTGEQLLQKNAGQPEEENSYDPGAHTVDEVLEYAADLNSEQVMDLIEQEAEGKDRSTLGDKLEDLFAKKLEDEGKAEENEEQ